jgi:serine/threonine-protein kinase RsbW
MPEDPRARPRTEPPEDDPFDWFLRIPNRLDLMSPVRALLAATCDLRGATEEEKQEILLAVSEVVNNAIEHVAGRGPDGYHEVDVRFGIRRGRAVCCILDEGEGGIVQGDFEGANVPPPDSDRGRGLFLVRAYVDEIRVRQTPGVGTEVRFVKRLQGGGGKA